MIFRIPIKILLFSWVRGGVFKNILNINSTFVFPSCKSVRLHRYKLFREIFFDKKEFIF
jgi:hypothetical protein